MPGGGLDALKSLLQQKKAEKQELVGEKKYVRKSELEEARLKRIREEEEAERRAKVGLQHTAQLLLRGSAGAAERGALGASKGHRSGGVHAW